LHTGDLARRDAQGRYCLVGRLKDMVRRGGENISSAEVEGVLDRHPAGLASAVIAVPDELWGEEVKDVVRLVPGATADEETAASIIEHARRELARFKVPRYLTFIDEFPMTPSERIAKARLRSGEVPTSTVFDFPPSR